MPTVPQLHVPTIAISGSAQRFPVRRIYCVGRNYAEHVREMGNDPTRDLPFFFGKPADAVVGSGRLPFPSHTAELHHEVELVVALQGRGVNVAVTDAAAMIFGHAAGIDLTRRDLQAEAKKSGRPWDMAKGFDHSAPIGPVRTGLPPAAGAISLSVDGQTRQNGDLKDMIWSVAEIIAALSSYVELAPGDLIFTGTPAGVGPIKRGETVRGMIAGIEPIEITFEE
ncbi:MAG TPA: fumarylacetoacetate hydrolase family protein [Steroidobacteraceae bacterium]|jgi:fumarylpyruvate hydrolase|nr:fumarylacetoacetate hydrolase family protein [Steroidobacteraceae bacterium]